MLLKDKLKEIRKTLGLNQQNIADVLGCKIGKIKQIETGKTATISFADAKLLEKKYRIAHTLKRKVFIGNLANPILCEDKLSQ